MFYEYSHDPFFDAAAILKGTISAIFVLEIKEAKHGKGAMLILLIFITGIVVGILPGLLKKDKMFSITNIVVGFVGALVGAFLGFGDAPLFLKYPFLNEITLMVAVSFLFVFIKVSVTRKRINP